MTGILWRNDKSNHLAKFQVIQVLLALIHPSALDLKMTRMRGNDNEETKSRHLPRISHPFVLMSPTHHCTWDQDHQDGGSTVLHISSRKVDRLFDLDKKYDKGRLLAKTLIRTVDSRWRPPAQKWSRHRGQRAGEQSSPRWTWSWPPPPAGPSGGPSGMSSGPASPPLSPGSKAVFFSQSPKTHLVHHPDWHYKSIPGKYCHANITRMCSHVKDWIMYHNCAMTWNAQWIIPFLHLVRFLGSPSENVALRPMPWAQTTFLAAHREPTLAGDHL